MKTNELLIIDGNSIANRAYYAMPFLSSPDGTPSGAVFGFANILLKIIQQEMPNDIIVSFDHARKTFRNEIYSEYKMQRKETPHELIVQFSIIKDMLKSMKIKTIEQAGIEADDIIGTVTKNYNGKKIVLSGDRDLLQLIDDNTEVWLTKKGVTEIDKVDEKRLYELYAISPAQVVDLKAIMGDASDNIPGVKGIGEKGATKLIAEFGGLDNIYQNLDKLTQKLREKLENDKDNAYMSKILATIKRDCNIENMLDNINLTFPFTQDAYNFFKKYDFSSILKNENIFSNHDIKESVEKIEFNKDNIQEFLNSIDDILSYDLKKFEFSSKSKTYFLSQNYSFFNEGISLEELCKKLKNVFENKNILKITPNAKSDMKFLSKLNIKLENYFDITLANYVASGGLKNFINEETVLFSNLKDEILSSIKEQKLDYIFDNIEKPLTKILFEMEENGFAINEEKLNEIDKEFSEKLDLLTKDIYKLAGEEFNINSPKQVAYILYDKLGLKTYNNKKQSTNASKLEELQDFEIVAKILEYRKLNKLKTGYIEVYKDICKKGGNIIHTTFNQSLTSTGRLSSSEPNLQTIPTRNDEGRVLRKIFVSKFENGQLISCDYNQIELRLLAVMSGEEKLIEDYQNGEDIHARTASKIFKVPIQSVTREQRRDAKAVNFGIIYGISDFGLAQGIKTSVARAKEYISSYFSHYPKVKEFMDNNVKFAKENGYAITLFGRKRKISEISSSNYNTRSFGERVAMNMPLQGTASDIIKLAMIGVSNRLKKENLKSQLILQIHDELIVDVFPNEMEKVKNILTEEMENVVKLKVPLIVSCGIGENLYECK